MFRAIAKVIGALLSFGAWLCLIAMASTVSTRAHASELAPITARSFVEYSHRSDLFTGWPFETDGREPTEDTLTFGAELTWPSWQLAISHGAYSRECHLSRGCDWHSATKITVRRYFGRAMILSRR